MPSYLASFLASVIPVLVAIKVAKDRRGSCNWSLNKVKSQIWISVLMIVVGQVVVFAGAQPFSPLALLSFVVEVFGAYRLSRAIYRKKDLATVVSSGAKTIKLNGWKRIGIVASVVWILGAGIYTLISAEDADTKSSSEITLRCEDAHQDAHTELDPNGECSKRGEDYLMQALPGERIEAAIIAFVPVPLGWGFIYLILFLVRWIKRGFLQPEAAVKGN